jgi:aryl-alcohol dehydrogenase-like predicted oxidoreductase
MNYKYLGKTGVRVSEIVLGTLTFGKEAGYDEAERIFNLARDRGINLFECADVYNQGMAEEYLGRLTAGCRDQVLLTSKVTQRSGSGVNDIGSSRRHIQLSVEKSLKRLKTDRIDLYFIHLFDPHTDMEDLLRTLDDLVRQGKILYPGVSNWSAWQIAKALGISARNGLERFQCIQPMYNLVKRQAEVEIFPLAISEGLGTLCYSPLGAGLLTGKYSGGRMPEGTRFADKEYYFRRYDDQEYYRTAEQVCAYAVKRGIPPAHLALAWVMRNKAVTAPIIGARNAEQLAETLSVLDNMPDEETLDLLTGMTRNPPPPNDRLEEVREKHGE